MQREDVTRETVLKVGAIGADERADPVMCLVGLGAWQDELGCQFRVRL
jgi:hypothetical protein